VKTRQEELHRPLIVSDDAERLTEYDRTPVNGRVQNDLTQNFAASRVSALSNFERASLLCEVVRLLMLSITCRIGKSVKSTTLHKRA